MSRTSFNVIEVTQKVCSQSILVLKLLFCFPVCGTLNAIMKATKIIPHHHTDTVCYDEKVVKSEGGCIEREEMAN